MFLSWARKEPKELCALWRVLFSFVRCPASGQLAAVLLKQSLQRLQLTAHTTDLTTMCAQNHCIVQIVAEFHKHGIDSLMLSVFSD